MKKTCLILSATVLFLAFFATTAQAREGLYMGLGIGGAIVTGDDPVTIESNDLDDDAVVLCSENPDCVTTEFGSGLATVLRFGYNIMGVFAIETTILGHGLGGPGTEGQGHLTFNGAIHPIGIANLIEENQGGEPSKEMLFWDPYVIVGGGLSWGAYEAVTDKDTKGWTAVDFQSGFGLNAHFNSNVSAGIDMRWTLPMYDEWIFNWGDDIVADPVSEPSSVIFTPMAVLTFHVL